jgi:hypothetical protein
MLSLTSRVAGVLAAVVAAGCQTAPAPQIDSDETIEDCTPELQAAVSLRVSVAPRHVPDELQASEGFTKHYAVVGRRVLLSIAPKSPAAGATILDSSITLTPYGGTFVGWGTLDGGTGALDAVPGRVRATPFLASSALRAQTRALDVVIQAGGAPVDQATIATGPLWDADRRPLPADQVTITLVPMRHFRAYGIVEARAILDFTLRTARSEPPRRCEVETRFTLVDYEAARPALWDLGTAHRGGSRKMWLALHDPKTGPVRAIFTDPIAARGFAEWIQQSGATRVARYQLGVFIPEEVEEPNVVPSDRTIMESFRVVSPEDAAALTVRMLAEP